MSCVITWTQRKFSLQPQKKGPFFQKKKFQIGISTSKFLIWEKKFSCQPQKCKLELFMSNGSNVLIYLSLYLSASISRISSECLDWNFFDLLVRNKYQQWFQSWCSSGLHCSGQISHKVPTPLNIDPTKLFGSFCRWVGKPLVYGYDLQV
jgi:hypothetical protein